MPMQRSIQHRGASVSRPIRIQAIHPDATFAASRRCRRRHHLQAAIVLLLLPLIASLLNAQVSTTPIAPNRYIVVYRNRTIPIDAETATRIAGARLLRRDEHLGIAAVQSLDATNVVRAHHSDAAAASDAETMRRLAAQPNVQYVLHDRIVTADRLTL